ncbi:MAG: hypothetical protein EA383_16665 [Spirochaetaceae bacterium]|nr:MAG: hypothetical protein EA383_16665 [Spirochaetaceae bacterium]
MVDEFGYIQNEVAIENVTETFRPLLDDAVNRISRLLGPEMSGLYLYGSVGTGRAVAGRSDIDLLVVLLAEPAPPRCNAIADVARQLEGHHPKVVRSVEIATTWLDQVLTSRESLGYKVFIKHFCVCIAGDDLSPELPHVPPSPTVCSALNGDAPEVLSELWTRFDRTYDEHERRRLGGAIARKILRTLMSVIAAETELWATGRADIASFIIISYPDLVPDVEFLLHAAEEQELALAGSVQQLRRISSFTAGEARRVLRDPF